MERGTKCVITVWECNQRVLQPNFTYSAQLTTHGSHVPALWRALQRGISYINTRPQCSQLRNLHELLIAQRLLVERYD